MTVGTSSETFCLFRDKNVRNERENRNNAFLNLITELRALMSDSCLR